ncbi:MULTISPECIES: sensor histidine kinase [unclassified Streptomyces]|uniref:sensor histidine kinase n=1 Tax=unclassified Streptomyces TaxID=2593676 RepID=UPI00339F8C50
MSLYWRIFLLNAAVLVTAVLLLFGPVTVSTPVLLGEAVVLLAGLAAMLIANAVLLRIGLAPLGRLTRAMSAVDLLRPGSRARVEGPGEVAGLTTSFNAMLGRLEAERAGSTARALSAQEAERRRIAQELHDEVGQTLTAVLLQLKHVADRAPAPLREELHQVQETTRTSLDEIRRIARRLRPGVLEELGLHSALRALTAEFTSGSLTVRHVIGPGVPRLDDAAELVVYRVAQEALTNAARHAGASTVEVHLSGGPDGSVRLLVRDDGRGIGRTGEGAGIQGMRERALLIGAELAIGDGPRGGTDVQLDVPAADTAAAAAAAAADPGEGTP